MPPKPKSQQPQQFAPPFKGFAAGKNASVQVPTAFFSELLAQIDDLAELKLTVYCFWALQQREGKYRYIRLRDLYDDGLFMAGPDVAFSEAVKGPGEPPAPAPSPRPPPA